MKLPYIKEMTGRIPKEINGFLKKMEFKVTFILINETFNLKRLFTFKDAKISYIVLVWFIASHAAVKARILVRLPEI